VGDTVHSEFYLHDHLCIECVLSWIECVHILAKDWGSNVLCTVSVFMLSICVYVCVYIHIHGCDVSILAYQYIYIYSVSVFVLSM